jgi:hypothetical protein
MQARRFIRRHELWRERYRVARDLDHLAPEQLSDRLFDCMNNARTRMEQGRLGLVPIETAEPWWIMFTEVMEECSLRAYSYPGPINISGLGKAFEHAFDPIPEMRSHLERVRGTQFIIKFGDSAWMSDCIDSGEFLLSPASFYEQKKHNHARRDRELSRILLPNPRSLHASSFISRHGLSAPKDKHFGSIELREAYDYYLFSLTSCYSARLFGDFNANACLVIHKPEIFLQKLTEEACKGIPGARPEISLVNYYDPVRADPSLVDVPFWKPFAHSYQAELRVIWTVDPPQRILPRVKIKIGCLRECANLVIA